VAGRPPILWRVARILRILGYVTLAIIIVYVASSVYFAVHDKPELPKGLGSSTLIASNSTVRLDLQLNISNPGVFPISGVQVSIQVRLPSGTLVAEGGSPSMTIAAASTGAVPVTLWVPLHAGGDVLLTHNVQLLQSYWANATFASLFVLHFNSSSNSTWGAPFYQFNATPGTPFTESNGTVAEPVTLAWQDAASFAEQGSVALDIYSASHQACGALELPVNVSPGANADLPATFYLASSCDPSGGTIDATYTGDGLTYAFPPEAIP
jgi:hypothetical protein